jgi:hypothetical protein
MMPNPDTSTQATREGSFYVESLPTAGALWYAGFKPVRVEIIASRPRFEYGAEARDALQAYLRAKHRVDDLIRAARTEWRR